MPLKKKKKKSRDFRSIHQIAVFLEETRLADYMDLMQRPHRLAWLNFWGGVWRGFGMAVGTIVLFAVILWGLKFAFQHVGGMPWVGFHIEEMIGWLLSIIDQKRQ